MITRADLDNHSLRRDDKYILAPGLVPGDAFLKNPPSPTSLVPSSLGIQLQFVEQYAKGVQNVSRQLYFELPRLEVQYGSQLINLKFLLITSKFQVEVILLPRQG